MECALFYKSSRQDIKKKCTNVNSNHSVHAAMVFEATTSAEVNNLDTSIIISPPPPLMGKTTTNKSAHQKRSPLNAAAAAPRTNNNTNPDSKAEESRKKRCSDRYDSSESSDRWANVRLD